jgi:hypothetical protein
MTLLDKTLSALGLMRVKAAKDWEARFKLAAKDLAQQAGEIEQLRPDAEKWRARAERERQRGQAKRKGSGK